MNKKENIKTNSSWLKIEKKNQQWATFFFDNSKEN